MSKGDLYTIVTNKKVKGKAGSILVILAGTKADYVLDNLIKIPSSKRTKAKEITLDMVISMKLIAKKCFSKATKVTDRFHVQKLALDALQGIRIKYRWDAIDKENNQIKEAKNNNKIYPATNFCKWRRFKTIIGQK